MSTLSILRSLDKEKYKESRWTENYLNLAKNVSEWSSDPSTKIGTVAVGERGQILSTGYNGFPRGLRLVNEKELFANREEKYKYIVHGEANCIYNATLNGVSLNGASLYNYGLPVCAECAKACIQVGIRRVFMCQPTKIADKWEKSYQFTAELFRLAGVSAIRYDEDSGEIISQHNGLDPSG